MPAVNDSYEFGRLSWELRTVNHRFLEFNLRLPEEFRVSNRRCGNLITASSTAAKSMQPCAFTNRPGIAAARWSLNAPLATRLLELHGRTAVRCRHRAGPGPQRSVALARAGGRAACRPGAPARAALELLAEAGQELLAGRGREGEQMAAAIRERLDGVEHWTGEVRGWLPDIRSALHQRMRERVAELGQTLEPERLAQEVAVLAQKMDVAEELDRLDAHVAEAYRTLELDKPVGRRLDFLMQEFNRESNTLSSKSVDQRTTQAAVELKVLIEQMREQVQNVE